LSKKPFSKNYFGNLSVPKWMVVIWLPGLPNMFETIQGDGCGPPSVPRVDRETFPHFQVGRNVNFHKSRKCIR
jgi:hypothetical protein